MRFDHIRHFAGLSVIGTVSLLPLLVLPAMVGVLVDNASMSESAAGWSASLNFLASSIIGLTMAVRVHNLNLRKVATVALILTIAADIASAYTAGQGISFFAARIAAGFALGTAYVAVVSSFARSDEYERGFGLFVTLQFIVSGLGLYLVPVYADTMGAKGLFLLFASMDFIALLLVGCLPTEVAVTKNAAKAPSELKVLLTITAIFAIAGFAMFEAANNAQFTYIERFGVALEISDEDIGFSLLIASLIGIPGAFSIVVIGQRFGTLVPLVFGIGLAIVGLITLINSKHYSTYFLGSCCMGFSWAFCLPFIQSLLASIDRKGSAIAAGSAISTLGSAFGPGLAAIVVVGGNYADVFLLSIGLFVVTVILFSYVDKHRVIAA